MSPLGICEKMKVLSFKMKGGGPFSRPSEIGGRKKQNLQVRSGWRPHIQFYLLLMQEGKSDLSAMVKRFGLFIIIRLLFF